ncbi:glycoside hydrolase family 78 protein [Microbacterium sp. zg.Y625]|uniref:alpha-L-rhamnosidase n=1 Tax=Microbacterium jiangjiandongii TaxID=3049071 RepID=UPI00214AC1B4|nr:MULTISPECIES: alpha-L-rhamnosidase [unclassified Microbacterium]MCR2792808.1 glycoside hydrolase family 78 protein [Microbacterium sp. zg.Y625]WIM26783.1 family 78 glycoside hydrolase catalytic domain [Microbacterium sp. zg-Y625]
MSDVPFTFIAPAERGPLRRVVQLRTSFDLDADHGPVTQATLVFTALGVVEPYVNGTAVSAAVLTPGWSAYEWRLRYAEASVRGLRPIGNTLLLRLAPGWYAGRLGWSGLEAAYGDRTAAAARLEMLFADGHRQCVQTDTGWQWSPDRTQSADLYDGQVIDARVGEPRQWGPVEQIPSPDADIVPYVGPPVVRHETITPVAVWRSPAGRLLVDFGQNLVGWTRLRVRGESGDEVVIRHAEVLEGEELGIRPLRSAQATDRYILSGADDEFEPTFTFHGFRYAEVEGWTGSDADLREAIRAVVVGSEIRRTGSFRTSHDLLNKLHENVVWGTRGNFLDVPTDCPQRDERLGWTGDIAVFAPTAAFLFDVQDFLSDWLLDAQAETAAAGGIVPFVVPDSLKREAGDVTRPRFGSTLPTAVWGDAAVWVPWALYQHDGDRGRLRSHMPLMRMHADAIDRTLSPGGLWDAGFQFGDWLDPAAPPEHPGASRTPKALVATASAFRTFTLVAAAADALGDAEAAEHFRTRAADVRRGFTQAFVVDGVLQPSTATGCALAIAFGLVDGTARTQIGDQLADIVRANGHRIGTGFAGTPYVTEALTITGHLDDAYALLLQTECPSWLYPVTMGATTVWERWDSMLPDGSINPGEMTSFNHYALGAVAEWLHRTVGGIAPAEPGYARVLVAPRPGPGIDHAETSLDSTAGPIAVAWRVADGALSLTVDLPTVGILRLPGTDDLELAPGHHDLSRPWDAQRHSVL